MTRAEYEKKYGVSPVVSDTPKDEPLKMTSEQYQMLYGSRPLNIANQPSTTMAASTPQELGGERLNLAGTLGELTMTRPLYEYVKSARRATTGELGAMVEERIANNQIISQIRQQLQKEQDPTKISELQSSLFSFNDRQGQLNNEIGKIYGQADKTPAQKAGIALGVGFGLTPITEIANLGIRGLVSGAERMAPSLLKGASETLATEAFSPSSMIARGLGEETALGKAFLKADQFTSPLAAKTAEEQLAFKAQSGFGKALDIAKGTARILPESTGMGYGFDVSQKLTEGKTGGEAFTPGINTILGMALPVGVAGARIAYIPLQSIYNNARSLFTPTAEMVKVEQTRLARAYEKFFAQRETTQAKLDFQNAQGKSPIDTLSRFGLVPDTEYVNGKTVIRTGSAFETAADLISERSRAIQNTLDNIQQVNPNGKVKMEVLEQRLLAQAEKEVGGLEIKATKTKIKNITESLREKYGDAIGVGDINRERVAANELSRAFKTAQYEADAFSTAGNVFRQIIDNTVGDKTVRLLNQQIGELIAAKTLLKAIDGKNIGGGRFTNIVASWAGAVLGEMVTPPGTGIVGKVVASLASMVGVKTFLRMLQAGEFGGKATQRILSTLVEDRKLLQSLLNKEPELVQKAFMQELEKYSAKNLLLESGKSNPKFPPVENVITPPAPTTFEPAAQKIGQRESIQLANTKQMTNSKNNTAISETIPQSAGKSNLIVDKSKNKGIQQAMGGIAGIEITEDENGKKKITFNPKKAAVGIMGMTAWTKLSPAVKKEVVSIFSKSANDLSKGGLNKVKTFVPGFMAQFESNANILAKQLLGRSKGFGAIEDVVRQVKKDAVEWAVGQAEETGKSFSKVDLTDFFKSRFEQLRSGKTIALPGLAKPEFTAPISQKIDDLATLMQKEKVGASGIVPKEKVVSDLSKEIDNWRGQRAAELEVNPDTIDVTDYINKRIKELTPSTDYKQYSPSLRKTVEAEVLSPATKGKAVVIDADAIKKLHPEYDPKNPQILHEESSSLSKELFTKALKQDKSGVVRFTAGGAGSAKSEIVVNKLKDKPGVIFDGVMSDIRSAAKKIDEAITAGKKVEVHPVFTDTPLAALLNQMRKRTVPTVRFVDGHTGFRRTMPELINKYGDKLDYYIWENFKFGDKAGRNLRDADVIKYFNSNVISPKQIEDEALVVEALISNNGLDWVKSNFNDIFNL